MNLQRKAKPGSVEYKPVEFDEWIEPKEEEVFTLGPGYYQFSMHVKEGERVEIRKGKASDSHQLSPWEDAGRALLWAYEEGAEREQVDWSLLDEAHRLARIAAGEVES